MTTSPPITPRPISASERTALAKLVDRDFDQVEDELDVLAADVREQRRQEVLAANKARLAEAEKIKAKLRRIRAKATEEVRKVRVEATDLGILVPTTYRNDDPVKLDIHFDEVKPTGLLDALNDANAEVSRSLKRAKVLLGRKRVEVHRQVLEAALSGEALAIAENVPSAREVLDEVKGLPR